MMHVGFPLTLAGGLAALGLYGALTRRHVIMLLLSLELLLAAANLALVTMGLAWSAAEPGAAVGVGPVASGQVFALFVLTVAAAELGVGLAVILLMFNRRGSADLASWRALRGGELAPSSCDNPTPATVSSPGTPQRSAGGEQA